MRQIGAIAQQFKPLIYMDMIKTIYYNISTSIEITNMNQVNAIQIFESLSSAIRLELYRLLVKNHPNGLVAGEIAKQLKIAPNNLSFHLKAMTHANLVSVKQEGRFQRYSANVAIMQATISYLTAECCQGNPTLCSVSSIDLPIK